LLSRVVRAVVTRARASVGTEESALVEYVAATVVSGGTLPLAGNAAFAAAPLAASEVSGTGTVSAPGAAVGIETASLALKFGEPDGAEVFAGGTGPPFGALEPEPPPPPQDAKNAAPRTAPPTSAEIRFMPTSCTKQPGGCTCVGSLRYRYRNAASR
jgi:hypothetical protein